MLNSNQQKKVSNGIKLYHSSICPLIPTPNSTTFCGAWDASLLLVWAHFKEGRVEACSPTPNPLFAFELDHG